MNTVAERSVMTYGNRKGKLSKIYACAPGEDCSRMYAFTHRASKVDVSIILNSSQH